MLLAGELRAMELTGAVGRGTESHGTDWCCWLGKLRDMEPTGAVGWGTRCGSDWCCWFGN